MRIANGGNTEVLNWGPGYNDGPLYYSAPTWYHNRGTIIRNNSGQDVFIPENTEAERNSVYRAQPFGSEANLYYYYFPKYPTYTSGDVNPTIRQNQVATGIYCWNGPNIPIASDPFAIPPDCPAGYNDALIGYQGRDARGEAYNTNGPLIYNPNNDQSMTYIPSLWGSTVPVSDWLSTLGIEYDPVKAGGTRESIYAAQSLGQGYFWYCSGSVYVYKRIAVRVCYKYPVAVGVT